MPQAFAAQTAEVMVKKEIQLPGELGLIKGKPARNRIALERLGCGCLDPSDDLDRLFQQCLGVLFVSGLKEFTQLEIAEIFLHDDSHLAIRIKYCWHRQSAFQKQTGNVQVWMNIRIERLRVNGRDRGPALPGN